MYVYTCVVGWTVCSKSKRFLPILIFRRFFTIEFFTCTHTERMIRFLITKHENIVVLFVCCVLHVVVIGFDKCIMCFILPKTLWFNVNHHYTKYITYTNSYSIHVKQTFLSLCVSHPMPNNSQCANTTIGMRCNVFAFCRTQTFTK